MSALRKAHDLLGAPCQRAAMAHALQNPPAGFDDLSVDQQIDYVQALWERIAAREAQVPPMTQCFTSGAG